MISIITIVYKDRRISNLLKRLIELPKPEDTEIIVVDSSKGTLDDIKKIFPKVKWICFNNITNKKFTYSDQRNMGVRKAKGEIIVFIDSDCVPQKNWLTELTKPIKEGKERKILNREERKVYDAAVSNYGGLIKCG